MEMFCHSSHRGFSESFTTNLRGHNSNQHPTSPTAGIKARQNPNKYVQTPLSPLSPDKVLFIAFVFSS